MLSEIEILIIYYLLLFIYGFTMCGIIGIATTLTALGANLGTVLYCCLKNLEYRGYDSVGFAVITPDGRLVVRKCRGKIDDVREKLGFDRYCGVVGIGHTRWATHGPPTDVNAHPHTDCNMGIAVVHNGIIENYLELREELIERGHRFISETDTEVIPHLVEEFKRRGLPTYDAFKKAVSILRGTFAIAMIDVDEPDKIFFARYTSPLVIGFGKGTMFVSSDIPAFLEYTNRVLVLRDLEVGYVTSSSVVVEGISQSEDLDPVPPPSRVVEFRPRIRVVEWSLEAAKKGGYPHFMLKEIHEQPYAIFSTISGLGPEIDGVVELIRRADHVFIIGAGTSYHASLTGSYLLHELAGVFSQAIIASEAQWYLSKVSDRDVVIAVSQSGETIDTLVAVRVAKRCGAKVVAVSNVIDSAIPRESDIQVYTRAGPEIGVAATKTFTTQLVVFTYLALRLGKVLGTLPEDNYRDLLSKLRKVPEVVEYVIARCEPIARKLSREVASKRSAYFLGRWLGVPISMEGALKLKEIAYIHAEAYPAGESKHGPIALVEPGFPVFFTVLGGYDEEIIGGNIEEMRARGAWTIAICPRGSRVRRLPEVVIELPRLSPYVATIPYIVPYQLIAYYTATQRGFDPDKPRNLAKTVTVM